MTSTFVKRAQKGRNHSIARVEVPCLAPPEPAPHAIAFAAEAAALRSNQWCTHLGFERSKAGPAKTTDDIPGAVWTDVRARLVDVLEHATLQDFVTRAEAAGVKRAVLPPTMYFI